MKPKKIAILYSGAKHSGGVETYLENVFKHADQERVELALFSLGTWPLTEKIKASGVTVKEFSAGRINVRTVSQIASGLKTDSFDLLVSQGTVANAYARAASLISRVPSLVTIHSEKESDYPNVMIRSVYKLSDLVSRWQTKRYITVSEYLKKKAVNLGIPGKKITVIYSGVEVPKELPAKKKNNRTMIGSIGRLHSVKNYAELIEAMVKLTKRGCNLTIWGEGTEREYLEEKVDSYGLRDNVFLPGFTNNVWEAFSGVDIYVQPSLCEGFGLTVVEAQLAGLPVVVAPGGALTELVTDGKTGVITKGFSAGDIAEALSRYISDLDLQEKCAQKGQEEARKRFDIENWAEKTIDAYLGAAK